MFFDPVTIFFGSCKDLEFNARAPPFLCLQMFSRRLNIDALLVELGIFLNNFFKGENLDCKVGLMNGADHNEENSGWRDCSG
jgi:hypothetical protein